MNLAEWLVRSANIFPSNPALYKGVELEADYQEFARRASSIAHNLSVNHTIHPGDHVAIFAKNTTEYLEALYGIWFCGAAVVPINAKLHGKEAAWIIENSDSKLVFVTKGLREELTTNLPETSVITIDLLSDDFQHMREADVYSAPINRKPEDLAWLFYTSGTTGKPKGVMISHANMMGMAHSYLASVDDVYSTDTACYAAPISHGAGLYSVQHVLKGAAHSVPNSGGFNPAEVFEISKELRNIHMFAAPTIVKRLVDYAKLEGLTGDGIRTIVYGGGPMYTSDIIEAVEVLGPKFCQIYGQGESPMTITSLSRTLVCDRKHPDWRERLSSVGTAQSSVDVKIFDEGGSEQKIGEVGEIVVQGNTVMLGYWKNSTASADALRQSWLWTGDMGSMDENGFITLKDRSKDVIISGGTNIYPREVEEVLLTHKGVQEVSVIGQADKEWGENVVAFIVVQDGFDVSTKELDDHCVQSIARFKRPKDYHFLGNLPKNNYGKVLKTELRKLLR